MKKKLILYDGMYVFVAENIMFYTAYLNYYKKTNKDYINLLGVYVSSYKLPFSVEIDTECLELHYQDTLKYLQKDLTFNINYFVNKYKFNIGIHNIFSSSPKVITEYTESSIITEPDTITTDIRYENSYDYVLFTSLAYYEYLKYDTA